MFNFHQKREFNDVSKEPAYLHFKQISFSKKRQPHKVQLWSILFRPGGGARPG